MKIIKEGQEGKGYIVDTSGFVDYKNKKNLQIINESSGENISSLDNPYVYCVLQKFGVLNRNNRLYLEKVLKNAVEKYQYHIKQRSALGATDHEDTTNVSLRKDSLGLLVEETYWEGNSLIGKIYLPISPAFKNSGQVCTEVDNIANLIFNHKIKIGISSRGIGEVVKKGNHTVVTDYDILCWDWVQMPSTFGSWAYTDESSTKQHVEEKPVEKPVINSKYERLLKYLNP